MSKYKGMDLFHGVNGKAIFPGFGMSFYGIEDIPDPNKEYQQVVLQEEPHFSEGFDDGSDGHLNCGSSILKL